MTWKECKELINADFERFPKRKLGKLGYLMTNHSFKITFWFRLGSYLQRKGLIFKVLYLPVAIIYKHNTYKTGIQMPFGTQVGGGILFEHFGSIVINNRSHIGVNCTIYQDVTIGSMRGSGSPTIGDNCVLFSGAKIIGNVSIGNHVVIGAGSVVTKNISDTCVVGGVPAKVISTKGKEIAKLYSCV